MTKKLTKENKNSVVELNLIEQKLYVYGPYLKPESSVIFTGDELNDIINEIITIFPFKNKNDNPDMLRKINSIVYKLANPRK
jgi:hypothetical protein